MRTRELKNTLVLTHRPSHAPCTCDKLPCRCRDLWEVGPCDRARPLRTVKLEDLHRIIFGDPEVPGGPVGILSGSTLGDGRSSRLAVLSGRLGMPDGKFAARARIEARDRARRERRADRRHNASE